MFSKKWRGRGGLGAEPRRPYVVVEGDAEPRIVRHANGRMMKGFYVRAGGKVHRSGKARAR